MFVGIEIEGVLPVIIMHKAVNPADFCRPVLKVSIRLGKQVVVRA